MRVPFTLLPFLGTTPLLGFQAFTEVFRAKPLVATAASTIRCRRVKEIVATIDVRPFRERFAIMARVPKTE